VHAKRSAYTYRTRVKGFRLLASKRRLAGTINQQRERLCVLRPQVPRYQPPSEIVNTRTTIPYRERRLLARKSRVRLEKPIVRLSYVPDPNGTHWIRIPRRKAHRLDEDGNVREGYRVRVPNRPKGERRALKWAVRKGKREDRIDLIRQVESFGDVGADLERERQYGTRDSVFDNECVPESAPEKHDPLAGNYGSTGWLHRGEGLFGDSGWVRDPRLGWPDDPRQADEAFAKAKREREAKEKMERKYESSFSRRVLKPGEEWLCEKHSLLKTSFGPRRCPWCPEPSTDPSPVAETIIRDPLLWCETHGEDLAMTCSSCRKIKRHRATLEED